MNLECVFDCGPSSGDWIVLSALSLAALALARRWPRSCLVTVPVLLGIVAVLFMDTLALGVQSVPAAAVALIPTLGLVRRARPRDRGAPT